MQRHSARAARTKAWAFLSIAVLCTALACSNLLDCKGSRCDQHHIARESPDAQLLVQSMIGDFDCALGSYVVATGLMSGEFQETTLTASRWSYDRRDIDPNESAYSTNDCTTIGTYTPLQTARFTADHALKLLEGWSDNDVPHRTNLIAHAAAYGGYNRVLLGEAFCTAGSISDRSSRRTISSTSRLRIRYGRHRGAGGSDERGRDGDILIWRYSDELAQSSTSGIPRPQRSTRRSSRRDSSTRRPTMPPRTIVRIAFSLRTTGMPSRSRRSIAASVIHAFQSPMRIVLPRMSRRLSSCRASTWTVLHRSRLGVTPKRS